MAAQMASSGCWGVVTQRKPRRGLHVRKPSTWASYGHDFRQPAQPRIGGVCRYTPLTRYARFSRSRAAVFASANACLLN